MMWPSPVAHRVSFGRAVGLRRRLGISDGEVEYVGVAVVVGAVERRVPDPDGVVAHGSGRIVGLRNRGDDLFEVDHDSHPALAPWGASGCCVVFESAWPRKPGSCGSAGRTRRAADASIGGTGRRPHLPGLLTHEEGIELAEDYMTELSSLPDIDAENGAR